MTHPALYAYFFCDVSRRLVLKSAMTPGMMGLQEEAGNLHVATHSESRAGGLCFSFSTGAVVDRIICSIESQGRKMILLSNPST
jgi:hypothetical protein